MTSSVAFYDRKFPQVDGHLAAVDATVERELAERFEIRGFPTCRFYYATLQHLV